MADGSLAKKLLIKPGQTIIILNPPPGYLDELGQLPEGVKMAAQPEGALDIVHLFVSNTEEVARLAPAAMRAVKRDGVFWISCPKQTARIKTDITRDKGWETVKGAGFEPVTQVSINEVWSALRFRPSELVKRSTRS
ncbi:MAG: hypothetical protein Q8R28_20225 [Dehalococcoidia bacterium]|nr:hypothetical protein [Dehalococcoidia bacterium]